MLFSNNINVMESNTCDTNLMRCGCDKVSVIWISLETIRWVLLSSFPLSIILTATRSVIKSQDRRWKRWQTFHVRHHHHHHQEDYLVAHFCCIKKIYKKEMELIFHFNLYMWLSSTTDYVFMILTGPRQGLVQVLVELDN